MEEGEKERENDGLGADVALFTRLQPPLKKKPGPRPTPLCIVGYSRW